MIINKTNNREIASSFYLADNPLKRMKGLLGRKSLDKGKAMVIRPCSGIHTFFMRFPIDVLFIDKESKVIKTLCDVKPFAISPILAAAKIVIELPAGTIKQSNTSEGHYISFS